MNSNKYPIILLAFFNINNFLKNLNVILYIKKVINNSALELIKIFKNRSNKNDKTNTQNVYPPKEGELMVEMLLDCIIFLAATYIPTYIG